MNIWTFLFGPRETPHRWICRECRRTWDTASDARAPRDTEQAPFGHPYLERDAKYPAHERDVVVEASDGPRLKTLRCGPVRYEGRFIHPLDYRRHGIDAPVAGEPASGHCGCRMADCPWPEFGAEFRKGQGDKPTTPRPDFPEPVVTVPVKVNR